MKIWGVWVNHFHIKSLWFFYFIPCFWKLLQFSSMLLTSLERIQLLNNRLNPQSKISSASLSGRFPFGYTQWSEEVGYLLRIFDLNSLLDCHPVLPTFRWILSTTENQDTLQPLNEAVIQSTPYQDDQSQYLPIFKFSNNFIYLYI